MARWDPDKNQLTLKIVFYGPALSGKTTNIIALHDLLQPELKGDMQILETHNDRTLFFDLLPLGIKTKSNTLIKLKLYTVPGQVIHNTTRKAVLSRSDGVIFVADSQNSQSENNAESFNNLVRNIKLVGLDIDLLPLVVQFNKRDLTSIVSVEELESRWKDTPWKLFLASALKREGVMETLAELLRLVYSSIDNEYSLNKEHRLTQKSFVNQVINGSPE